MKIAVCVKHVPAGRVHIDPTTGRIDRGGTGQLNEFDANAIEEALRIKGDASSTEVIVVSMGPDQAIEALHSALALGADRAVLVEDIALIGSDVVATSVVLAKALERVGADIVLFGQQASDGGGAVLWSAVAERLRVTVVSQVTELSVSESRIRATRQTEFGDEVVEAAVPVVVAVTDAINEPRYASLRGMMGAKRKPLETISVQDLGIDPSICGELGSMTKVIDIGQPPIRANTIKITDEGQAAGAIIEFMIERQIV